MVCHHHQPDVFRTPAPTSRGHRPQALNLALLRVVHRSLAAQRIVEALEAEDSWKGWGAGEGENFHHGA